jgi:hypothetical protein
VLAGDIGVWRPGPSALSEEPTTPLRDVHLVLQLEAAGGIEPPYGALQAPA